MQQGALVLLDCVSHFDKCRKCDLLDFFFHVFNKRGRVLWLYLCVLFLVFVVKFFFNFFVLLLGRYCCSQFFLSEFFVLFPRRDFCV
jgi:hypothetical protein